MSTASNKVFALANNNKVFALARIVSFMKHSTSPQHTRVNKSGVVIIC